MGEFFRPFQRKLGLLTLGLACVFMAGWLRSLSAHDVIAISRNKDYVILFESCNGQLSCTDISTIVAGQIDPYPGHVLWWTDSEFVFDEYPDHATVLFGWKGFGLAKWQPGTIPATTTELAAPYWPIVLPLTTISAWLLRSKRRQAVNSKS